MLWGGRNHEAASHLTHMTACWPMKGPQGLNLIWEPEDQKSHSYPQRKQLASYCCTDSEKSCVSSAKLKVLFKWALKHYHVNNVNCDHVILVTMTWITFENQTTSIFSLYLLSFRTFNLFTSVSSCALLAIFSSHVKSTRHRKTTKPLCTLKVNNPKDYLSLSQQCKRNLKKAEILLNMTWSHSTHAHTHARTHSWRCIASNVDMHLHTLAYRGSSWQ